MKITGKDIRKMVSECVKKVLSEMQQKIDNFDMFEKILDIKSTDDFHYIQVIKRLKDNPHDDTHQGNYWAKAWYLAGYRVHNGKELQALKPQIVSLCEKENARAYITINSRSEQATNNFVKIERQRYSPTDPRYIHADDRIPAQRKEGPNWKGVRKRVIVDVDVKKDATTYDGINIWDETRKLIKMMGITPLAEYESPSGGLHILLPDKEDRHFEYLKKLFQKFDNWIDKGTEAKVHAIEDAKLILYSNVKTKGW